MTERHFEYDPFQKEAMHDIDEGFSLMVSAPTGSGKTVIAEYVIDKCLKEGRGAIYTAPIKALSNQKYRDFCERYGADKVGIVTGDVAINAYAPILIMTTEIFRNALFDEKDRFQEQSWVIFDEIHYIDDFERGTVWEESLMFFPKHMRMLCLSATIPNLEDVVQWIQSVHSFPVRQILETHRPIPLQHHFHVHQYIGPSWNQVKKVYDQAHLHRHTHKPTADHSHFRLLQHIKENNHLPCIYFVFARRRCEELSQASLGLQLLSDEEKKQITTLFYDYLKKYNLEQERSALKMLPMIERGIAYHHAGMLPSLKEVIERLFCSRLIKLIFTTETFALGINMPARAVVFDELRKFYGVRFENLRTRDYYQMAGRAGRRGLDDIGYVYARVDPYRIRFHGLKKMLQSPPEPVMSQFNTSYATLMHLYAKFGEELYDIYLSSFHFFQSNRDKRKTARKDLTDKIKMLREMGYIADEKLTTKGLFASQMYGYELMLGEMFDNHLLESISPIDLNIILGAIIYEPRKREECPPLSDNAKELRKIIRNYSRHIARYERKHHIEYMTEQGFFHLSPIIEAWSRGEDFDKLEQYGDADEGEIVRNMRMIIQLLRLLIHSSYTTPAFKSKAKECIQMINRGAVDAERQLRIL